MHGTKTIQKSPVLQLNPIRFMMQENTSEVSVHQDVHPKQIQLRLPPPYPLFPTTPYAVAGQPIFPS